MSDATMEPGRVSRRSSASVHGAAAGAIDAPPTGRVLVVLVVLACATGTVLRFLPRGDLWLDEALSANIASLPLGDIPEALRRDGHPPLYYWLLHLWGAAEASDWWTRALSGVLGTLSIPLAFLAGRRVGARLGAEGLGARRTGLITAAIWAMLPFAVRYGSETRMYALVSLLVLVGYLLMDNLLGRPRRPDLRGPAALPSAVGLTLVTAALLWTHYWSLWLGVVAALAALVVLVRSGDPVRRRRAVTTLVSLAAGVVLFTPWVPSMLHQSDSTGTPWGEVFRPATIVVVTITDFVGGGFGELQIMSYVLVAAVLVALFGVLRARAGRQVVELTVLPQPRVLTEALVLVGTLLVGWAASVATSTTYASRYAAVVAPFFAICVAGGLAMVRTRTATAVAVGLTCGALLVGAAVEVGADRTEAGVVAEAIGADRSTAGGGAATVLTCPDQLSPATERALAQRGVDAEVIPYPTAGDPRFVNWEDYADRNAAADPVAFLDDVLADTPDDETVYLVVRGGYLTFEGACEQMLSSLSARGGQMEQVVNADFEKFFENMDLWVRRPAP